MMAWPRRNPPNDRPIACSRSRASSAYRGGHEAQEEVEDRLAVDDDEHRQHEDDQDVAHDPDARDGGLLERTDQVLGGGRQAIEEGVGLGHQVHLAEAEPRQAVRPRLEDRRQLLPQGRHVPDELEERVEQGLRQDDDDRQERDRQDGVDGDDCHDAGEPRHGSQEEPHRRREDEGEQPGQEEREDDVAEVDPVGRQVRQDDQRRRRPSRAPGTT